MHEPLSPDPSAQRWKSLLTRQAIGWVVFGLIFLVSLGVSLSGPLIVHVHSGAAKAALRDIAAGSFAPRPAELLSLAIAVFTVLVKPLVAVGAIWICELLLNPDARRRGDLGLLWFVQTTFITFGTIISLMMANSGLLPEPLIPVSSGPQAALSLTALPAFLLFMLISDFFDYWCHRAQHAMPLLWRFHAIHHSHDLDVLHNVVHPVERLLKIFLVAIPTVLLIRPVGDQVYLFAALIGLQGNLSHTRLPIHVGWFRWLLTDNRYHFVHHSRDPRHHHANFAAGFPLWDYLFGTYRKPPPGLVAETGLNDRLPPATFREHLVANPAARS